MNIYTKERCMKKEFFPIKKCSAGNEIGFTAYRFTSKNNGPKIHIQSNLHGSEVQGNIVIAKLINYFKSNEFNGSITLIPQINPIGINQKSGTFTQGRFSNYSGENFNRTFYDFKETIFKNIDSFLELNQEQKTDRLREIITNEIDKNLNSPYGIHEGKRFSLVIQKEAIKADIVLDLHTAPSGTHYAYTPEYLVNKCRDLDFPNYIIIPNDFAGAMDESSFMPHIHLNKMLTERGLDYKVDFEVYTLELGSEESIDSNKAEIEFQKILFFLSKRNVISYSKEKQCKNPMASYLKDFKTYHATDSGMIEFTIMPGQMIDKNDELYKFYLSDKDLNQISIRSQKKGIVLNHTISGNFSTGMEVLQILEAPFHL